METTNNDQTRIRDYLLGNLSGEEQQKIEERLMVEDDLFEELEISKEELVEEYRAGELSGNEKRWFETHYLASPEGTQSYTFTVALKCLKRPAPQPHTPPQPQPKALSWFERLTLAISQPRWAVTTVSAVLVAAIGLWLIYPQIYDSRQTTLAVTLETSAISRGPSEPKFHRIKVTSDVRDVKIDLMIPDSVARSENYRVEFDNRSGTRKTLNLSNVDTRSVSVVIPSDELAPGLYALKLTGIKADGTEQQIGDYFFEVTN